MSSRLIIDGNAVYEIDENCVRKKQRDISARGNVFENDKKQRTKSGKNQKEENRRR